jgi:hypothetical protein
MFFRSGRATACGAPQHRRLVIAAAILVGSLAAGALAAGASAAEPPVASPTPGSGAAPLPHLYAKDSIVRVKGKIVESTRGNKGPVRLEIERSEGGRLSALVAPDERCDQLGLSLRPGEEVELEGSLFQGRSPILAVTAVIVGGSAVPVRDQRGAPLRSGSSAAPKPAPTR